MDEYKDTIQDLESFWYADEGPHCKGLECTHDGNALRHIVSEIPEEQILSGKVGVAEIAQLVEAAAADRRAAWDDAKRAG